MKIQINAFLPQYLVSYQGTTFPNTVIMAFLTKKLFSFDKLIICIELGQDRN